MDRASVYGTEGCGFDSLRACQFFFFENSAHSAFTGGSSSARPIQAEVAIEELGFTAKVAITDGEGQAQLTIPGATPWSPATPRLYDIDVSIATDAGIVDTYTLPFGFRTIEVRDDKLL